MCSRSKRIVEMAIEAISPVEPPDKGKENSQTAIDYFNIIKIQNIIL